MKLKETTNIESHSSRVPYGFKKSLTISELHLHLYCSCIFHIYLKCMKLTWVKVFTRALGTHKMPNKSVHKESKRYIRFQNSLIQVEGI